MARFVDARCECGNERYDLLCDPESVIPCQSCGNTMEQIWTPGGLRGLRQRDTCWSERESVVVFQKPDGTFSFPARNDKPCPEGWTKHVARSDRELGRLENMTGTLNESRWFDKGSGRAFDDYFRGKKVVH